MQELPAELDRASQKPPPAARGWRRGDSVRVRGNRWTVEAGQPFDGCELVRLVGAGPGNRGRRLSLLSPFDRLRSIDEERRVRRVGYRGWLRSLRTLLVTAAPYGRLRTAAHARVELHGWQMEPALALLNGFATRILLADAVGLGKTIQAALVVSELRALQPASRTLVLSPAGLRDQWQQELRDRFDVPAVVSDADMVRRTVSQLAAGTNPWATWPVIIASLDFVKRAEVLRALDIFTWDLLVVDEAHVCALAPERSNALHRLAARARRVVLVTATPHAGDDRAFASLCAAGSAQGDDAIVMFRRRRADVGLPDARRVHLLRVRCTDHERRVHSMLGRYTREVWAAGESSQDARLAMVVLKKRALSSMVSLLRSLERRANALFDRPFLETQLALPFAGAAEVAEQTFEDEEPAGALAAPAMESRREREWLDRLVAATRLAARCQSKRSRLLRLLARANEPAIVFTEYRDTARWLAETLQPVGPVVLLHGALSRRERQDAEREFTRGRARVLVATDAAGEGLNLHHRCRLVINLELPWNPMRLEQRVGRVDRIGQRRRPHALHLVARATDEERIVERLVVRQQRAHRSIGGVADAIGVHAHCRFPADTCRPDVRRSGRPEVRPSDHLPLTEDDVTAAVMSGSAATRATVATDAPDTAVVQSYRTLVLRPLGVEEQSRLRAIRRLGGGQALAASAAAGSVASVALLPNRRTRRLARTGRRLRPGVVCVFVCRVLNGHDDVLEELPVCVHLPLAGDRVTTDLVVRQLTVDPPPAVRSMLMATLQGAFNRTAEIHRRALDVACARERAIASTDAASQLIQPGMFDARALKALRRSNERLAARELERVVCAPAQDKASRRVVLGPPHLALALVVSHVGSI